MSAGAFTIVGYEANDGKVFPLKVQPETLTAVLGGGPNSGKPAGDIQTGLPSALVSLNKRAGGVKTRGVRLRFTGDAPPGYKSGGTVYIPVPTLARYNAIPEKGGTGTYLEQPVVIVGKSPEKIN